MCPLCIGTAAWLVSGGTSAGGLAAVLLKQRKALPAPARTVRKATQSAVLTASPASESASAPLPM
jgi:hypothetical protein